MNKNIFAIIIFLAAIACTTPVQPEIPDPTPEPEAPTLETMRFTALAEDNPVKTSLDGNVVRWDENDRISVFDGTGNRCFTIESIRDDGSAIFVGDALPGQPAYYASYPFSESSLLSGEGELTVSFTDEQTASTQGTFGNGFNVSVATATNGSFAFKNVGGLIRFVLSGNNVTSIRLKAGDGGAIGGTFRVAMSAEGAIESMETVSGIQTISLEPALGGTFAAGEYFFCVPARSYTSGIKMLLDTSDGEQIQASLLSEVVVMRSKITSVGTIDTSPDKAHRTLTFTPIESLNPEGEQNSHTGLTQYSTLTPIYGTDVFLDDSVLGTGPDFQYPRFVKASNGDFLLFYHPSGNGVSTAGNRSNYLRSSNLTDWTFEKNLFKPYSITDCQGESNTRAYAGAHPIRLPNGNILAVAATRALKNYASREADNGLSIRISTDNGESWGAEQLVLVGTVWEPFPIVLSSGRIQIYYTDYDAASGGSGTSYIYSDDGGVTWTSESRAFAQVWYRDGQDNPVLTDQMPAVIELNGTHTLAGVCESKVGTSSSFTYYLSLAYSSHEGSWGSPDADGVLPAERNNAFCQGAAPCLIQFPSGETVLSYNTSQLQFNYRMGNTVATDFSSASRMFDRNNLFWGSMMMLDSHRVLAGAGGTAGLQIGQFYLNHAITASPRNISVDSRTMDWDGVDEALWLCSAGQGKATVRASVNAQNLYILAEVEDVDLSGSDYLELTFARPSNPAPDISTLKFRANYRGLQFTRRFNDSWEASDDPVSVRAAFDGTSESGDTDHGYLLEVGIPLALLPIESCSVFLSCTLSDAGNTCDLTLPILGLTDIDITGTAGNGNAGTGAFWTYESGDLVW